MILGSWLLLSGCQKIFIEAREDGTPEFQINFTIDGDPVTMIAGDDDVFNFTSVSDFFPNREEYFGELTMVDDSGAPVNGERSLAFEFRLSEAVRNAIEPNHFESFNTGNIPFFTVDNSFEELRDFDFSADYDGSSEPAEFRWDFGDGAVAQIENPAHQFSNDDIFPVQLVVEDELGCASSTTSEIFYNEIESGVSIAISTITTNGAVLEASSNAPNPSYNWDDGSNDDAISIDIPEASGQYQYCVTMTDGLGRVANNCIGIIREEDGGISHCTTSASITHIDIVRFSYQFNAVRITYFDGMGGEFVSETLLQPSSSYFNIVDFEEFDPNADGMRTVKVTFEAQCDLFGDQTVELRGSGSIAVAIP